MPALMVLMGGLQVAALVVRLLRKGRQAALLLAASAAMPLIAYGVNLVRRAPLNPTERNMVLLASGRLRWRWWDGC